MAFPGSVPKCNHSHLSGFWIFLAAPVSCETQTEGKPLRIPNLNFSRHKPLCLFQSHCARHTVGYAVWTCQDSMTVFTIIFWAPTAARCSVAGFFKMTPCLSFPLASWETWSTFQIPACYTTSDSAKFKLAFLLHSFPLPDLSACVSLSLFVLLFFAVNWHHCCHWVHFNVLFLVFFS